ncbi:uncharacterized protein CLUP02_13786 [Colletotrichum lupini]|uniref:Uncharacterized protein n=1 Tax=Colletotrichum lupini TaxID=145971 RepID=A0A9Q8T3J9_9PEZI|nr:uncharacterized protein CLUP02_13786 [Colletotrichum lupini]UQC88263.1 hypothetical protein CLUP02_13786 [Colletotrichum lupini]
MVRMWSCSNATGFNMAGMQAVLFRSESFGGNVRIRRWRQTKTDWLNKHHDCRSGSKDSSPMVDDLHSSINCNGDSYPSRGLFGSRTILGIPRHSKRNGPWAGFRH